VSVCFGISLAYLFSTVVEFALTLALVLCPEYACSFAVGKGGTLPFYLSPDSGPSVNTPSTLMSMLTYFEAQRDRSEARWVEMVEPSLGYEELTCQ
jgi:hypothetical protein